MNYKILGQNIAKIRIQNHLTQEKLAEKTGVSTVFVSQIETAVRKPSLETLYKISLELNTTIDFLIGNNSSQVYYDEIAMLIKDKNPLEISFITRVLREICRSIKDEKIIEQ